MKLGLHYHPNSANGPGKVASNLIQGLEQIGVTVCHNQTMDINGCLQSWGVPQYRNLPSNTLMGPNLMVLPSEDSDVWQKYNDFIVPSRWVLDKYNSFEETKGCNLHIWPVGIDTEKFFPNKDIKYDCLIYFKSGSTNTRKEVISMLEEKSLTHRQITYGSYNEEEFIQLAQSSRFGVVIDRTESQGIAYQEMLSMNLPLYVVDRQVWDFYAPGISFPATSAPYFDDICGIKHPDLSRLEEFIEKQEEFDPIEYVLENLTLKKCASEYVSLLENFCGENH